jgi:6-pyruvoyl tetrahydropterin synthase/QueD family protein
MHCLECHTELECIDNKHLLACAGITVQEYAIRHHLPLELVLHPDQINKEDAPGGYPRVSGRPDEQARNTLAGLRLAGLIQSEGPFAVVSGGIRRLDQLLWVLQGLEGYGFRYCQEYRYGGHSHRVVALNRLKTLAVNLGRGVASSPLEAPDFMAALAVYVAHAGLFRAGYLFMPLADACAGGPLATRLAEQGIRLRALPAIDDRGEVLLRTETLADTQRLLQALKAQLLRIPGAGQCFFEAGTQATVVKELGFDSAHFITDHPGRCARLHGGRYAIQVKITDRIDPMTGFVIDYSELKRILKRRVIDRLDHQSLNYVDSGLAWRSSTELLCIYVWERLIDYLPGLAEVEIHETAQSYCRYTGPSLAEFQCQGVHPLLSHFQRPDLGGSPLRERLLPPRMRRLKVIGDDPA